MKKIISVFVILVMGMALFTACGSSGGKVLSYNLLADDTYEVSISVEPLKVKGKLKIPAKYKGKEVTRIASNAFKDCKNLSAITLPETITYIGRGAFSNTGIWNESKSNSVVYIGNWVVGYKGERNTLTSLTIEPGTIGIAGYAFNFQGELESAIIPDSVTTIGAGAFSGCDKLTSIKIPMSVTVMGETAFTVPLSRYGDEGQALLTIYVEAPSKPEGWSDKWINNIWEESALVIEWGYEG